MASAGESIFGGGFFSSDKDDRDMVDTFEGDFFTGVALIHIELDLLSDLWEELKTEFAENGWRNEEDLPFTLAAGLAALRRKRQRQHRNRSEEDLRDEINRIHGERLEIESRYAVMKYRTYQFMQASKVLEMKLKNLDVQLDTLRQINARLRARLD